MDIPESSPAVYAVLVLLLPQNGQYHILLEVRSRSVHQPGEICLPGGYIEPGETPRQAVLRELQEELNLPQNSVTFLTGLAPQYTNTHRPVAVFVGTAPEAVLPLLSLNLAEVSEAFLLPLNWLLQTAPQHFFCAEDGTPNAPLPPLLAGYLQNYSGAREIWYWEYGRYGIWGLTARILRSFCLSCQCGFLPLPDKPAEIPPQGCEA